MRTDQLIHHLADMTGQRTREGMDVRLLDLVQELMHPRHVSVYRLTSMGKMLRWSVRRRESSSDASTLSHLVQHAASPELQLHRDSWNSGEIKTDPLRPTLVLVPMPCDDETHCLVEIEAYSPPNDAQLSLIQEAQSFYKQLQRLVSENERDALTRLLNRKSFDQHFLEMAIAPLSAPSVVIEVAADGERRTKNVEPQRCWLAVVDIDHFKRVNDTFGHLIGDEVLIMVARLLNANFRADDRLYRFGGEEFVVMLNTPSSELTTLALERVRKKIETTHFTRVGQLTISIGFTEVKVSDTPSSAFERADECVYRAKSQGRNQVVGYDSLMNSHISTSPAHESEVEFF